VLAHPGRYKINGSGMKRLIAEFREHGGAGIEVLSSSHTAAQAAEFATLARVYGLLASCGSDYHGPGESWLDLGDLPAMPAGTTPVWTAW
jgi:predicted metal-dependent phosphoesterase TrpH